ncbi:MAG: DUF1643 domain-containing protein [Verrucomicrobiota bacterium]
MALFIGLNPSTADAESNDPTIRRECGFAESWGYTGTRVDEAGNAWGAVIEGPHRYALWRPGLVKCNLYALRSTDPAALLSAADPVGPKNDEHLRREIARAPIVICAWGSHPAANRNLRASTVKEMIRAAGKVPHAIRLTKGGHPEHPLYLPKTLRPLEMQ